jgi:cardiolipin synthase
MMVGSSKIKAYPFSAHNSALAYLQSSMNWLLIAELSYLVILLLVCLRIIYDTRSSSKTLAYLLFAIFFPIVGMIFYFSFGINYRKRKLYNSKWLVDEGILNELRSTIEPYTLQSGSSGTPSLRKNRELANLLARDLRSQPTRNNRVKLLVNGEEKFPEILEAVRNAREHIHVEYYVYEDDSIGNELAEALMERAAAGVKVRFIYDDFGSRGIRRTIVPRLRAAGVEAYPFHRIHFILLANRLNYRNHRKILIVDGQTAFTGGINISERYYNRSGTRDYWRDNHLRIDGPGVYYLQYLFLCDWQFCTGESIEARQMLFALPKEEEGDTMVQIAASGPDSDQPAILYSLLQAVYLAEKELLITTPYFIPGESMLEAIKIAALSGLKVKLLVPNKSDSRLVNAAARSYYAELMQAGVEIYLYTKGFVHAKTLVADGMLAVVGSANMDHRSFELNFEVNALVYDSRFAAQMRDLFYSDLENAKRIEPERWANRKFYRILFEKLARLASPLM